MEYVNTTVLNGIRNAVLSYIDVLGTHLPLDARESVPLIEIQLELIAPELVWQPELRNTSNGLSVHAVVSNWLESFMNIGFWIKRLDGNGDYLEDLKQDSEVKLVTKAWSYCHFYFLKKKPTRGLHTWAHRIGLDY